MGTPPSDPTIDAIDRFYDFADRVVDGVGHFFGRVKKSEERVQARRQGAPPAPSSSTAIARRPQWRIDEIIDGATGKVSWIVTDGGRARAECTTLELAEKLRSMLEAQP